METVGSVIIPLASPSAPDVPGARLLVFDLSVKQLDVFMSASYFAIGFSPITALMIAIFGVLPLYWAAMLLVFPATVLGLFLGVRYPFYGKLALQGIAVGLIAVTLYDCMRFCFIALGLWGDFIPNIGKWLLDSSQQNWLVGYTWRYVGDGGFMGMAFVVGYILLRPRINHWLATIGFGVAVWLGLLFTLLAAPHGQQMLFKLTPTTFGLSLLGHLIYGSSVGLVLSRRGLIDPTPLVSGEATTAGTITAGTITAGTITAGTITAG